MAYEEPALSTHCRRANVVLDQGAHVGDLVAHLGASVDPEPEGKTGPFIGVDTDREADDVEIDSHGVRVVIDPISLPYLQGSTVDYHDGLMGAGFSFENPNVASTCGCNASFQAKPGIDGPYSPKADGCG